MRSCLASFFDSSNLGDLLIANTLEAFSATYGPVDKVSYSGRFFDFPGIDALPPGSGLGPPSPGLATRLVATRAGNAVWLLKTRRSRRHDLIRRLVRGADLLVIGGGNMLFDLRESSRSSDRFHYFVTTATREGTPTFATSLGIGPFATARQHRDACRALDLCRWVTFRDNASLGLYLEHGRGHAEVSIDPVLMLAQVASRPAARQGRIALNVVDPSLLRDVCKAKRAKVLCDYAAAVRSLVHHGFSVELFTTDRADESCLAELETLVNQRECYRRDVSGVSGLLRLFRTVDVVVASRMHALIVAFTQGAPILGLSWQSKVDAFFDVIHRHGQVVPFFDGARNMVTLALAAAADPEAFSIRSEDRSEFHRLNAVNCAVMEARASEVEG